MYTLTCGQVQTAYAIGKNSVVIHIRVNIMDIVLNRYCKPSVRKYMNQ
jgi:hypothetical protein